MKVVAFNGSPKKEGNTFQLISSVAAELSKEGIEVEIIHVGASVVRGCIACGMCGKNQNGKCIINDDVNGWIEKMKEADGVILGSPTYFSGVNGTMKAFLDRAFFVSGMNGNYLRHKVGTAVVAVRRSGGIPTWHELNNYLMYTEMFIPTSNYWNVVHGRVPGETLQDEEGQQIVRVLGKNMAFLMKSVNLGKENMKVPEKEAKAFTHFIR
ncbi:MAG: flavodoxin family protein [Fusobacteria bacterium]|nr:flavodoxin family protein [Fusobacteriota bacterium]